MPLCSSSAEVGMGPPQNTPLLACLCWRTTCCCSACWLRDMTRTAALQHVGSEVGCEAAFAWWGA